MVKFQREWDESPNGWWTYRLIPDLQRWMKMRRRPIGYYITQFLSGHGCFNAYLYRFKKQTDAVCMYCGHAQDDVEHTFFVCDRWFRQRRKLEVTLGFEVTPERIGTAMVYSKSSWVAVVNLIKVILTKKECDERA